MKMFIVSIFVLFFASLPAQASETSPVQGGVYESQEQLASELPNADHLQTWVCYSRYVGWNGVWNYYGWAYNAIAARNNALYVCQRSNWNDPYRCFVTGCYIR